MNVLLAVLAVGVGSVLFRVAPLLGADRLSERVSRTAAWAGVSVLAAITVRSVATHQDATLSPATPAPLLAALAVGLGLLLAHRGRSVLMAVASGAAAYLVLSEVVSTITTLTSS